MSSTLRKFYAGQVVTFEAAFYDEVTGDLIDPSSVEFKYQIDGGSIVHFVYTVDAVLTRTSVGQYQVVVDSTGHPGLYNYIWASHGQGQGVATKAVLVHAPKPGTSYSNEPQNLGALVATSLSPHFDGMYEGVTYPTFRSGEIITFTVHFSDKYTGAPLDPASIQFAYQVGSSTTVTRYQYQDSTNKVQRIATGAYIIMIDSTDLLGLWNYTWSSATSGQATLNQSILVKADAIETSDS